ncbi:hypothetical protein [Zavarzinia compransoris]|uniref:hypothetical protein n=1 Tax=Zavarzinia compransoris TaxID=1264899 RepID=UPI0010D5F981|nr:hypothetical protein [Zavarzinia compransoris]TDP47352.1 hypothetical protein DES42_103524 [Zavarzinia compransoris]
MSDHDTEAQTAAVQYQVVAVGGAAQIIAFPMKPKAIPPQEPETAADDAAEN